jgi:hypothetical protein
VVDHLRKNNNCFSSRVADKIIEENDSKDK